MTIALSTPNRTQRDIYRYVLANDFCAFFVKVFETLHPGQELIDNWHIEALCAEVVRFLEGDDLHLVANLSPRALKSEILSVALPAWLLGKNPSMRIICASYSQALTDQFARDTKAVMEADWYKDL